MEFITKCYEGNLRKIYNTRALSGEEQVISQVIGTDLANNL